MGAMTHDLQAWDLVAADLGRVVGTVRERASLRYVAPLHHRLAVIRLRCGVLTEVEQASGPRDADQLLERLDAQLDQAGPSGGVLDSLTPSVRADAMAALRRALSCDPDYGPALRASAALAQVAGRWLEAVAWLRKLVDRAAPDAARGRLLVRLGDIHWRKLDAGAEARGFYQAARAHLGDDPDLLDNLLKLDLDLENWEPAIETCHTLIELVRGRPDRAGLTVTYLLTLGEIHVYGLKRPGVALAHYLRALQAMPGYALTYTLVQELLEAEPWDRLEPELVVAAAEQTELAPLFQRLRDAVTRKTPMEQVIEALRAQLVPA